MSDPKIPRAVATELAGYFSRNGYVRQQDAKRLRTEGYEGYKKGDEVRLIAETRRELASLRRALQQAEFTPGKPFEKGKRWCQPIYGREAVSRFLRVVETRRP
ncbi:MAG: hypothetical protein O3A20_09530 [Planctomycetota bacterium]|nr:hypothetical protein [Planctomycetota bacterium]